MSHSKNVNKVQVGGARTVEDLLRWELEHGEFAYHSIRKDNKLEVTKELSSLRSENQNLRQSITRLLNYIGKDDLDYVRHFLTDDESNSLDPFPARREGESIGDNTAESPSLRLDHKHLDQDVDSNFRGKPSIHRPRNIKNVNNVWIAIRADHKSGEDRDSLMTDLGVAAIDESPIIDQTEGKESSDIEEHGSSRGTVPITPRVNMDLGGECSNQGKASDDNNNSSSLNLSVGLQLSKEKKPKKLARDPWAGSPEGKKGAITSSLAKCIPNENETLRGKDLKVEVNNQVVSQLKEPDRDTFHETASQPLVSDITCSASSETCDPRYQEVQENTVEEECNKDSKLNEEQKRVEEVSSALKKEIDIINYLDCSDAKTTEYPCIFGSNLETKVEESKCLSVVKAQDEASEILVETATLFSARSTVEISLGNAKCDKNNIDTGVAVAAEEVDEIEDVAVAVTESYVENAPCVETMDTGDEVEDTTVSNNAASEDNISFDVTSCGEITVPAHKEKEETGFYVEVLKSNEEVSTQELSTGSINEGIFLETTKIAEEITVSEDIETAVGFTDDKACLEPCLLIPEVETYLPPLEYASNAGASVVNGETENDDRVVNPKELTMETGENNTHTEKIYMPAAIVDSNASAKSITFSKKFAEVTVDDKETKSCVDDSDEIKDNDDEENSSVASCEVASVQSIQAAVENTVDACVETDANVAITESEAGLEEFAIAPHLKVENEATLDPIAVVAVQKVKDDIAKRDVFKLTVDEEASKDVEAESDKISPVDDSDANVKSMQSTDELVNDCVEKKASGEEFSQSDAINVGFLKNARAPDAIVPGQLSEVDKDSAKVGMTLPVVEMSTCSIGCSIVDIDETESNADAVEIGKDDKESIQVPDVPETIETCLDASAEGKDISVSPICTDAVDMHATMTLPDVGMDVVVDQGADIVTNMDVNGSELPSQASMEVPEVETGSVPDGGELDKCVAAKLPEVCRDVAEVDTSLPTVESVVVEIERNDKEAIQMPDVPETIETCLDASAEGKDISVSPICTDAVDMHATMTLPDVGMDVVVDQGADIVTNMDVNGSELPSQASMEVPEVETGSVPDGGELDKCVAAKLPEVCRDIAEVDTPLSTVKRVELDITKVAEETLQVNDVQETVKSCLDGPDALGDVSLPSVCTDPVDIDTTLSPATVDIEMALDENAACQTDIVLLNNEIPSLAGVTLPEEEVNSFPKVDVPDGSDVAAVLVIDKDVAELDTSLPTVEVTTSSIGKNNGDINGAESNAAAVEIGRDDKESIQVPNVPETIETCLDASAEGKDISVSPICTDAVDMHATMTLPDVGMDIVVDQGADIVTNMDVNGSELPSQASMEVPEVETGSVPDGGELDKCVAAKLPEVCRDVAEVDTSLPTVESVVVEIERNDKEAIQMPDVPETIETCLDASAEGKDISVSPICTDAVDMHATMTLPDVGMDVVVDQGADIVTNMDVNGSELPSQASMEVPEVETGSVPDGGELDKCVAAKLPEVCRDIAEVDTPLSTVKRVELDITKVAEETLQVNDVQETVKSCLDGPDALGDVSLPSVCTDPVDIDTTLSPATVDIEMALDENADIATDVAMAQSDFPAPGSATSLEVETDPVCQVSAPASCIAAKHPELNEEGSEIDLSLAAAVVVDVDLAGGTGKCMQVSSSFPKAVESPLDVPDARDTTSVPAECADSGGKNISPQPVDADVDVGLCISKDVDNETDIAIITCEESLKADVNILELKMDSVCSTTVSDVIVESALPEVNETMAEVDRPSSTVEATVCSIAETTDIIDSTYNDADAVEVIGATGEPIQMEDVQEADDSCLDASDASLDMSVLAVCINTIDLENTLSPAKVSLDIGLAETDKPLLVCDTVPKSEADFTGEMSAPDLKFAGTVPEVPEQVEDPNASVPAAELTVYSNARGSDDAADPDAYGVDAPTLEVTAFTQTITNLPGMEERTNSLEEKIDGIEDINHYEVANKDAKFGAEVSVTQEECDTGVNENIGISTSVPNVKRRTSLDSCAAFAEVNTDVKSPIDAQNGEAEVVSPDLSNDTEALNSRLPLEAKTWECAIDGGTEVDINAGTVEVAASLAPCIPLPDKCLETHESLPLGELKPNKADCVQKEAQDIQPRTANLAKVNVDLETLSNESLVDDIPTSVEEANKRLQAQVKEFTGREKILKGILAVKYKEAEELRLKIEDHKQMIEAMKQIIEADKVRENYLIKLCQENKQKNLYLTRELEKSKAALNELQRSRALKEEMETETETSGSQMVSTPVRSLSFSQSNSGSGKEKEKKKKRRKTFSFLMCTDSPDRRGDRYDAPVERKEISTEENSEYVTDFSSKSPSKR